MEGAIFPRLFALAERAWSAEPAWTAIADDDERDLAIKSAYHRFVRQLGERDLSRLEYQGIEYRIPKPGAEIVSGGLYANARYQNLKIRFSSDGSDPTHQSPIMLQPILIQKAVERYRLAAFAADGRRSGVVEIRIP